MVSAGTGSPNLLLYSQLSSSPPPPLPPSAITLTVTRDTNRAGRHRAFLAWAGATSASVGVYGNGPLVTTTANDGSYTDNLRTSSGTFTYKVCLAGTSTRSNEASITF